MRSYCPQGVQDLKMYNVMVRTDHVCLCRLICFHVVLEILPQRLPIMLIRAPKFQLIKQEILISIDYVHQYNTLKTREMLKHANIKLIIHHPQHYIDSCMHSCSFQSSRKGSPKNIEYHFISFSYIHHMKKVSQLLH